MDGFLSVLMIIISWMQNTTLITLKVGDFQAPITFMELFVGFAIVSIGITFLHKVFDW